MSKKNNQPVRQLKPEEYIRLKARQLPVYKCYKSVNHFEDREMCIIVVRQHPQGNFTFGAYMIDKWCLGIKDSLWQFNVRKEELDDFLSMFRERLDSLDEIEYVEAHNWVYGAYEFAADAGIKPCKEFALTRYLLEDDDDSVELIEYEFGRGGEYCLVAKDHQEAARYIPILDRNLGKGNYTVEVGWFGEDIDDDESCGYPFDVTPPMDYSYAGGDYPKEVSLHFPEVESIVMKDTSDITDDDIDMVQSFPSDKLRADLQNLVLRELGRQWGKSLDELEESEENWCVVGNSLMFLTTVATVEDTLPVVLEVMRQSAAFSEYNFGDASNQLLDPVLCLLVKDNPRLLKPFLLEAGLYYGFKLSVLELLEHIARQCPDVRQGIIDMTVEILQQYKVDLPGRTICDGSVVAFAIGILVSTGSIEHLPLIEELYATGLVDESCEGHIDEVRRSIRERWPAFPLPPMNPRAIRDDYKHQFPKEKS